VGDNVGEMDYGDECSIMTRHQQTMV